ncbi:MAG: UvrB/UvrC motif-containing protein [Planctomycetota bacterium]
MMLCENCQKNVATVHLTEIVQKAKKEVHLCNACAKSKGISLKPFFLLSDVLGQMDEGEAPSQEVDLTCPECGTTYAQFRAEGRLGCPNDYEVFKAQLTPFMEKVHNSLFHCGKVPHRADPKIKEAQRTVQLRRDLSLAVENERYEEAARIRDELKKLGVS